MRQPHQSLFFTLILAAFGVVSGCSKSEAPKAGEILLWHWMTDREEALQQLTDAYHKQSHTKIRLELYAPSDAYASKVRAAAQTNTLPDIFSVLGETREFPPGNQYNVPPGIYGVPIDVTNIQMLYNKDLFKQAGLDPDRPPQSWNEFLDDWHRLKAAGLPGLVSGWGETWMIDCFANNYAFNVMGEEKVLNTYRGKVSYTDPDWIKVLSLFDTIRKEGILVSGVVTMVNKTAEQTFATGKATFAFNGSWCVNVYKGMNPDLAYAAFPPPPVSKKYPMRIWGGAGSSFMVNEASPNKEASVQFLKWLTQPEQQVQLSKETLNLPANKNSVHDLPPVLVSFASRMDMITHPSQWPVTEKPTVTEALDKGIQSILIGEKTPEQVGADVQAVKDQQAK